MYFDLKADSNTYHGDYNVYFYVPKHLMLYIAFLKKIKLTVKVQGVFLSKPTSTASQVHSIKGVTGTSAIVPEAFSIIITAVSFHNCIRSARDFKQNLSRFALRIIKRSKLKQLFTDGVII